MKTSRDISTAIKTNLDGGNLASDRFEATYDKLVSEKKLEELSRFIKNDAVSNTPIQFETTAASNRWKTVAEIQPTFSDDCGHASFSITLSPPTTAPPDEAPSVSSISSASLDYGRWYVLFEMKYGSELVMSLGKFSKPGTATAGSSLPHLVIEGVFVPMKEMEAVNTGRLPPEKIGPLASRILSGNDADIFRHPGSSGQHSKSGKVIDKNADYPNAGKVPLTININSEASLSPDGKWVFLNAQGTIQSYLSDNDLPAYAAVFVDTIRLGSWIAIPAERHPAGNSAVLFIKVSNLGGTPSPVTTTAPDRPLPDSGIATKVYTDIHPRILRDLPTAAPRGAALPLKSQLIANGIPDGSWAATAITNSVLIGNADVSIHKRIATLLAEYTWTKEIAEKSAAGR